MIGAFAPTHMCPSQFGRVGGIIFAVVGILGLTSILGPTSTQSFLGEMWWIDWFESIFYVVLGLILLGASFLPPWNERPIILFSGWLLLLLSVWGSFFGELFTLHFENPIQTLFYLVMSVWALSAGLCKEKNETRAGNLT